MAILLLIFVPVHPEYFGLCDRLRDAGYRPTAADAEVARASSWQTHCHMVGGALGFVASPLVEATALAALLPRGWPAALDLPGCCSHRR